MAECQNCPLNDVVKAVAKIASTQSVSVKYGDNREMNAVAYMAWAFKNKHVRKVCEKHSERYTNAVVGFCDVILPCLQEICKKCSETSDDDNLSHQGKCFVSMDAMTGQEATDFNDPRSFVSDNQDEPDGLGNADLDQGMCDEDDDSIPGQSESLSNSTGSWFLRNQIQSDSRDGGTGGVTKLPLHIEDVLRQMLASFCQLDIFDQILVLSQTHGQTFPSFGTMKWIPPEMKRPQSKQVIGQHWDRICKKFPIARALRDMKPAKDMPSNLSKNYSPCCFQQDEFNFCQ